MSKSGLKPKSKRINQSHTSLMLSMQGMALLTCVEILFTASLLMISSRLLLSESALLSSHIQERQVALQAAQSALTDARAVIHKGLFDVMSNKNIVYGSLTGNRLQLGGRLQPKLLPLYRIQQFEISNTKNTVSTASEVSKNTNGIFYRVTVLGYGAQLSTQVILESDFSKIECDQSQNCENFLLRRINWRLLYQLPADWE